MKIIIVIRKDKNNEHDRKHNREKNAIKPRDEGRKREKKRGWYRMSNNLPQPKVNKRKIWQVKKKKTNKQQKSEDLTFH